MDFFPLDLASDWRTGECYGRDPGHVCGCVQCAVLIRILKSTLAVEVLSLALSRDKRSATPHPGGIVMRVGCARGRVV
ncbi:MAG TPA: hypothetical protein VJ938_09865, partial [Acidimicrobiia bacterium]|nr:hypothetical protein [Acidimicrobiia bacterium]